MIKWLRLGAFSGPMVLHATSILKKEKKHSDRYSLKDRSDVIHHYSKKLSQGGFRVRFLLQGEENLQKGQALYIGNHCSLIDPILFYAISDMPLTVVAKKEVKDIPLFGKVVESVDGFFLDRKDLRSELKTFMAINKKLEEEKDLSLLIYPEGTRSKAPDFPLLPFHAGTFKLATKREIPIVPVCMYQTDRVLNQKFHYHVYPIQVSILKPLTKEEYEKMTGDEIASLLHERMEEELKKMRDREEKLIQEYNHYSAKKTKRVIAYKK